MDRYKKPSPFPKMIAVSVVLIMILLSGFRMIITPENKNEFMTSGMIITIGFLIIGCCILGSIVGLIIHAIVKPSGATIRQIRLQEEQNRMINRQYNNNKFSISEELNRLNLLKNNGTITEEEFNRLKEKLINN